MRPRLGAGSPSGPFPRRGKGARGWWELPAPTLPLWALLPGLVLLGVSPLQAKAGLGPTPEPVPVPPLQPASDTIPPDTYLDAATRALVERGRRVRATGGQGIGSYEARVWERIWIGLEGPRSRRQRTAFAGERAARVRWDAAGERVVRWEGARQAMPMTGARSDEDGELAQSLAESLASLGGGPSAVLHEPGDDRIVFGGGDGAIHPLSDSAAAHYRYRPGDTLGITLPPDGRSVTLAEVLVEPRRPEFRLVAGSLWFDVDRGDLVRAAFRPARALPVTVGLQGLSTGRVLRFLGARRALEVEIRQVNVDYTLHEMEWWLPHRYALTVEARAGSLLRVPVTMEWRMDAYRVNAPPSAEFATDPIPPGWSREVATVPRGGWGTPGDDSVSVVTLVPDPAALHGSSSLRLPERDWHTRRAPMGFPPEDLGRSRDRLDQVLPPAEVRSPALRWGLDAGLTRYNRVEGFSTGIAWEFPIPLTVLGEGVSAWVEGRTGTAQPSPGAEARLQRGRVDRGETLAAYRRLGHASDWEAPLGLGASLASLVLGGDHGEYHRVQGGEMVAVRRGPGGEARLRLFGERHQTVERGTHFHLPRLVGSDTLRLNRPADEGTWYGATIGLQGHRGADPAGWRTFGGIQGEAASGRDGSYQRAHLSGGVTGPLGPVAGALEGGVGAGWGALPVQKAFHLGGGATVRGVTPSSLSGESFWFLRGEVARPAATARAALFGDLGWVGPRKAWGSGRPVRSIGVGVSILDGLLRVDLARQLDPLQRWRLHLHLDGLL